MASLPKPKQTDWELELPDEQAETNGESELAEEDAAERDRRNQILREAAERADFKRRTQVVQRNLPRPSVIDVDTLLEHAANLKDPAESLVAKEVAFLIINDALKYPDSDAPQKVNGTSRPLEVFSDDELNKARLEIALEMSSSRAEERQQLLDDWQKFHTSSILGLENYQDSEFEAEKQKLLTETVTVSLSLEFIPS